MKEKEKKKQAQGSPDEISRKRKFLEIVQIFVTF